MDPLMYRLICETKARSRGPTEWKCIPGSLFLALSAVLVYVSVPGLSFGQAANIYVASTAQGANNGMDCADAYAVTFFNTSGNWGNGASQIGPGTTVHLCGAFSSATQGGVMLTTHGNGASGNPIIIQSESGNTFNSTGWWGSYDESGTDGSGAIVVQNNYITLDGKGIGVIQNMLAGSTGQTCPGGPCSQHPGAGVGSVGIFLAGGVSYVTVQNWTIQNIYLNGGSSSSATDTAGVDTADIRVSHGATNISIDGNTLNNSRAGIWADLSSSNIYNNSLDDHCWQMNIGGGTSVNIYNNTVGSSSGDYGYLNWQYPISSYHTDGIIASGSSGNLQRLYIYDNLFVGDLGLGSPTGMIFSTYGASGDGSGSAITAFNNVFVGLNNTVTNDALIYFHAAGSGNSLGPHYLYNNTFVNGAYSIDMDGDTTTDYTLENNVFVGNSSSTTWFFHQESVNQPFSTLILFNNNDYYNGRTDAAWDWNGTGYATLLSWQSACGCDGNSVTGNPNLSSAYTLQAGSAAIDDGANLESLDITALDSDKAGTARPLTGAWDMGAYQGQDPISPPSNVTASAY